MTTQPSDKPEIQVFERADELAAGAAEVFISNAQSAIAASGRFTVALSGGTTPRSFLRLLATSAYAKRVDWSRTHLFWGDERCVPPTDAASNFRMARQALIDHVDVPAANVHRMEGEGDPVAAAAAYEQVLREVFGGDGPPRFDLILLGMGDNGHVASLFPGKAAVRETKRWVMAEFIEDVDMWRLTLTPPTINAAADVTFVVCGGPKADVVRSVIERRGDPDEVPALVVSPSSGRLRWLLDAPAAAALSPDVIDR